MEKRYFDVSIDDAVRIAVVKGRDARAIYEAFTKTDEISAAELPDNFNSWIEYTSGADGECSFRVMSEDGF